MGRQRLGCPLVLNHLRECLQVLEGHTGRITAIALSVDAARAISGSADSTLRVWDVKSGECLCGFTGDDVMTTLSMTADATVIVAGDRSGMVHIFTVEHTELTN
jgi:WD40 repeat protein